MSGDENDLRKLSAYLDGQLTPGEAAEIDAALTQNERLAHDCARLRRTHRTLQEAALNETIPIIPDSSHAHLLETLREQIQTSSSNALKSAACGENAPEFGRDRSGDSWRKIQARTVASGVRMLSLASLSESPRIRTQRWEKVWSGVSARTRKSRARPAQRNWAWTFGVGMAACIAAALLLFRPAAQLQPSVSPLAAVRPIERMEPMVIPDSVDERYGVAVRYVAGENEPVVHLYLKSSNDNDYRSTNSDASGE